MLKNDKWRVQKVWNSISHMWKVNLATSNTRIDPMRFLSLSLPLERHHINETPSKCTTSHDPSQSFRSPFRLLHTSKCFALLETINVCKVNAKPSASGELAHEIGKYILRCWCDGWLLLLVCWSNIVVNQNGASAFHFWLLSFFLFLFSKSRRRNFRKFTYAQDHWFRRISHIKSKFIKVTTLISYICVYILYAVRWRDPVKQCCFFLYFFFHLHFLHHQTLLLA